MVKINYYIIQIVYVFIDIVEMLKSTVFFRCPASISFHSVRR